MGTECTQGVHSLRTVVAFLDGEAPKCTLRVLADVLAIRWCDLTPTTAKTMPAGPGVMGLEAAFACSVGSLVARGSGPIIANELTMKQN